MQGLTIKGLFFICTLGFLSKALSHGEDKPGPNGGFIRMPGAFHTELIVEPKNGSLKIFLLDINFMSLKTEAAKVSAQHRSKKGSVAFVCERKNGDLPFLCLPQKPFTASEGTLQVNIDAAPYTGTAQYELPLKWNRQKQAEESTTSKPKVEEHKHHH